MAARKTKPLTKTEQKQLHQLMCRADYELRATYNVPTVVENITQSEYATAQPSVEQTLTERGNRYGDFTDHAQIAQDLQDVIRKATSLKGRTVGWDFLSPTQRQALTVIADKIARILSGDPNYADNWHDIQGYAKLVEDRLPHDSN